MVCYGVQLLAVYVCSNSAVELSQFGETILPPPDLFDTARCCSSLGNDPAMFLLPPPAEFACVSRASSTADLPLPPPPAFFDVEGTWPTTDDTYNRPSSRRLDATKPDDIPDVFQSKMCGRQTGPGVLVDVNGFDEFDAASRQTTELSREDISAVSCNGVVHCRHSDPDADERLLVPVSTPSSQPAVVTQSTSFATDVISKLDELCRSKELAAVGCVSPPSSAATVIPVHHETTSPGGTMSVHQRRCMGQSWSDGLFIWDAATDTGLIDKLSKRHSAGATMSDMVVSSGGGLGARPKIPHSRSAFDGVDWRRRQGVLSPHHQGRLFSRHTPDGREFRVHSASSRRVEVKEELRHRSLEPDDHDEHQIQSQNTSADTSRISGVLSDSSLPSASTELTSRADQTRRFLSQQSLSSTGRRRNLLEQACERRKATRMTCLFDTPSSLTDNSEMMKEIDSIDGCDDAEEPRVSFGNESSSGAAGPVRVLVDRPMTSRGLPMTSSERSMETVKVARPPSLVVRTSDTGSPVRVMVAAGSPSSQFDDDDIQAFRRRPPLCSPEDSFDTASEAPSGRTSPATTSVSTFQGHITADLTAVSTGSDTAAASTATSTSAAAAERHFIVVAIDFGTTYSGYAFSFVRDPDSVHMMRRWEGGDPGVVNQKTPTTLLLDPAGKLHSFGYAARDSYHDLDTQEAKKWLYFDKFKMVLHHNAVSTAGSMCPSLNPLTPNVAIWVQL